MIARPFFHVRVDDAGRRAAERGLPRDAVALGEAHLQLRRVVQKRAGVHIVAFVHGVHHARTALRIGEGEQPGRDLVLQRVRFCAGRDDPLTFTAFEVQIHLTEAHGVRLRARPIDVFPELAAAAKEVVQRLVARRLAAQRHEAFLHEPRVEVHRLAKRVEPMIGDDQNRRRRLHARHDFADELIAPSVHSLDRIAEPCSKRFVVHRMIGIDQTPHHVLDAIG